MEQKMKLWFVQKAAVVLPYTLDEFFYHGIYYSNTIWMKILAVCCLKHLHVYFVQAVCYYHGYGSVLPKLNSRHDGRA